MPGQIATFTAPKSTIQPHQKPPKVQCARVGHLFYIYTTSCLGQEGSAWLSPAQARRLGRWLMKTFAKPMKDLS